MKTPPFDVPCAPPFETILDRMMRIAAARGEEPVLMPVEGGAGQAELELAA